MILNTENRLAAVTEAFQRLVVKVEMCEFDFISVERIRVHREAVVVRSDLYFLRDLIQHRVIGAAMTELQFVGLAAQCDTEDLMAQANAKDRFLADQIAHLLRLILERLWIAWSVGEEDAIGLEGENVFGR